MSRPRNAGLLTTTVILAITASACHRENSYEDYRLSHWYDALRDTSALVRAHAAEVVARAAPEHPETLRRLLDALARESDSSVHVTLAGALGEVVQRSGSTSDVISSLELLTHDVHETVRITALYAVARAIVALPPNAPPPTAALATIDSSLRHVDHETRLVAAEGMGRIAAAHPAWSRSFAGSVASVVQRDPVTYVRLKALEAFVRVPKNDSLAIVVYANALHDHWPDVTTTVLRALANSPGPAAVLADSVVPLLDSDDAAVRALTARAIASAGLRVARPNIIASLKRVSADRDSTVRAAVHEALLRLRGDAR